MSLLTQIESNFKLERQCPGDVSTDILALDSSMPSIDVDACNHEQCGDDLSRYVEDDRCSTGAVAPPFGPKPFERHVTPVPRDNR